MTYSATMNNCFANTWIGAVYSNQGNMKYWGALCPYITGQKEEDLILQEDEVTYIASNPSSLNNSYWVDTCTVRHKGVMATSFSSRDYCVYA